MADEDLTPCDLVPNCPVCNSPLSVAHTHVKLKICVCRLCGTSLTIPDDAWVRAELSLRLRLKQA